MQLWNRSFKQPCYQTEHLRLVPTKNIFSSNFSSFSLSEQSSSTVGQGRTFPIFHSGLSWVTPPDLSISKEPCKLTFMRNPPFMLRTEIRVSGLRGRRTSIFPFLVISFQSISLDQSLWILFPPLPPSPPHPVKWQILPLLLPSFLPSASATILISSSLHHLNSPRIISKRLDYYDIFPAIIPIHFSAIIQRVFM